MKKNLLAVMLLVCFSLPIFARGTEPVKLFTEADGSPGKVHPLTLAHMQLHPSEDFFYNENYFFIAITDQGYYGYVNLLISNTGIESHMPGISYTIVTPDLKRHVKDVDFKPSDLKMAKDRFALTLGSNFFKEVPGGYALKIAHEGMGMELTFKNQVPGFVLGTGWSTFGAAGADKFYISYPGPRPEVTGKFSLNGKDIPVKGWGYIDHSVSYTSPSNFERSWHNIKFNSPTHTVLVSSFTTPDKFERDFGFAVITDQSKVLCAMTDVKVTEEGVKVDAESGKPYPAKVRYELKGDRCSARAVMDTSKVTEKFDVLAKLDQKWWGKAAKLGINTFIAEPWYFRAVAPAEFEITVGGQTVKAQGRAFNEIIFTE